VATAFRSPAIPRGCLGPTFRARRERAEGSSRRTWVAAFTPAFDPADLDFDGVFGFGDLLLLPASRSRIGRGRSMLIQAI
jgi:hypothetical protein